MSDNFHKLTSCPYCNDQKAPNIIFNKNGYEIAKCKACHLVYVGNPPSEEELTELYSFKYGYHKEIGNNHNGYPNLCRAKNQYNFLRKFANHGALLDVGCSAGFFLNQLKQHNWFDIHGLEISSDTAAIAQHKFGFNITTGTLQNADFKGKKFDVITLWDVIEHVKDPLLNLQKAHGLLNDNGIIIIETPNIDGLFPKVSKIFADILNYWPHPEPPGHLFQFSVKTLSNLVIKAGFQIEIIQHQSIPLSYSFGNLKDLLRMPKRLAYAAVFAPLAMVGPIINSGDTIRLVAKKG